MTTQKTSITPQIIIQLLLVVVLIPLFPILISWRWDWWEAWVNALICIGGFIISRVFAARKNPGLLTERSKMMRHDDIKSWDKILAPLVGLGSGLVLVVAGLDGLFRWSPAFSLPIKLIAIVAILAGFALGSWALYENRFFSGVVRIQKDRGQHVISTGPYAWVRHPGYIGAILSYLAMPFLLDSIWALIPAVLISAALIIRTSLEDQTLQAELPGYADYARQVRYRLLPGVW
jgi:protein-S-isoprenylcysteine O-methyltransferase Ste14